MIGSGTLAAGLAIAALLVAPQTRAEQALARLSLDDAGALGTVIASDAEEKAEGRASVRIASRWPTTVNLGEVAAPEVAGGTLIYRARVKAAGLTGTAYLEMWAHFGPTAFFSRGLASRISGDADWRTLETPFYLEPGQRPSKLTLNLVIDGSGTVWVDDVRVIARPAAP